MADERSAHLLTTPAEAAELERKARVTQDEWLGIHGVVFLVVSWNIFAINLARTPGRLWFWIPAAVLAGVLAIHALWLLVGGELLLARKARPRVSREEGGR